MKMKKVFATLGISFGVIFIAIIVIECQRQCWEIDGTCLDYVGTLHVISGSANVKLGSEKFTVNAGDSVKLNNVWDEKITLSQDGSAEIIWDTYGRTILGSGTELDVATNSFTYKQLSLQVALTLNKGRIWTRLDKPLSPYEYFVVLSDRTIVGASGVTLSGTMPLSFGVSRKDDVDKKCFDPLPVACQSVDIWAKSAGMHAYALAEPPPDYWYITVGDVLTSGTGGGRLSFPKWNVAANDTMKRSDMLTKPVPLPEGNWIANSGKGFSESLPLSDNQLQDSFFVEGNKRMPSWWAFWAR